MDLSPIAVPPTLSRLEELLPAPPARILEAGCGRGALAAALAGRGYEVVGVDRDADMVAAAKERGVHVLHADVRDVTGEYDVVLFTRSLHHADDLDGILAHAASLAPGGLVVLEEFAWERVDRAAAHFLHDTRALLVAAGLLHADVPADDPLDAWVAGHDFLLRGSVLLDGLRRLGAEPTVVDTAVLWRLVDGRGGTWDGPADRIADVLAGVRAAEERRLAAGLLPPVGLLASVRL